MSSRGYLADKEKCEDCSTWCDDDEMEYCVVCDRYICWKCYGKHHTKSKYGHGIKAPYKGDRL